MYKWAVYLNNKCSKEQPEALSVVWKKKRKKRKTQNIRYHGVDKLEDAHQTIQMSMRDAKKTFAPDSSVITDLLNCQFPSIPRRTVMKAHR